MGVELVELGGGLKDDLVRICNDVDRSWLSDRMPDPYSGEDADEWLEYTGSREGADGFYRIIMSDGTAVGEISAERDPDTGVWTAGYFVSRGYCNRGIATEALGKMCDLVFGSTDAEEVAAWVLSQNAASIRVLEKNGFVRGRTEAVLAPRGRVMTGRYLYSRRRQA